MRFRVLDSKAAGTQLCETLFNFRFFTVGKKYSLVELGTGQKKAGKPVFLLTGVLGKSINRFPIFSAGAQLCSLARF